ncbi:hypothetical protein J5N97_001449 [Dioscorea zingiberensis]|uniref:Uncharacterized protein n=1 Tax=Dioscorea zingiberensis TaxID=325984 RepID=A0A9D5H263_9LILI|nr:hypothetical protein J5N97_001449 [Dioscorea zingiberensis]
MIGQCSSPQVESSSSLLIDQPLLDNCFDLLGSSYTNVQHQEDMFISENPFLNLALMHYNFIDFPQEMDSSQMMEIGSRTKDDCQTVKDLVCRLQGFQLLLIHIITTIEQLAGSAQESRK